ncbi:hypothetical protein [uncultured Amnibacterium sp.]|uniref:hypothetical protein n=1 Tax=uncultured Amnibacterium sp. TaxID=1631851 RepID=UPI0035CB20E0
MPRARSWAIATSTSVRAAPSSADDDQIAVKATDPGRIADGAGRCLFDAALIKPNQIGTVTQTLSAVDTARSHGMSAMISHRSGETLDTFIADLAVGTGVGRIKSGALARGERVAKYNRLAEIARDRPDLPYGLA